MCVTNPKQQWLLQGGCSVFTGNCSQMETLALLSLECHSCPCDSWWFSTMFTCQGKTKKSERRGHPFPIRRYPRTHTHHFPSQSIGQNLVT